MPLTLGGALCVWKKCVCDVHEAGERPRSVATSPRERGSGSAAAIPRRCTSLTCPRCRSVWNMSCSRRCDTERLFPAVQVVGADDADVERADIAPIPVVAGAEVDAVELDVALVERAAVVDPEDQRLGLRIDGAARIVQEALDRVLERLARRRQQIAGAARRARKVRVVGEVGRHQEGECAEIGIVERVRCSGCRSPAARSSS